MLLQLTLKCDNKCIHCMNSCDYSGKHMNFPTVIKSLKFMNKVGNRTIVIGGGEPTLHPKFIDILKLILKNHKKLMIVAVTSNGNFLQDEKFVKQLIPISKKNARLTFQISCKPEFYENSDTIKILCEKYKNDIRIFVNDETFILDRLGRGRDLSIDFLNKFPLRQNPNCSNLIFSCINNGVKSLKEALKILEMKNQCKPMVDIYGNIHAGESIECGIVGSIDDSLTTIHNNIKNYQPCGKCGIIPNDEFKLKYILNKSL